MGLQLSSIKADVKEIFRHGTQRHPLILTKQATHVNMDWVYYFLNELIINV